MKRNNSTISPLTDEFPESDWYETVYYPAHKKRYEWMIDMFAEFVLKEIRHPRILDVGCGYGDIGIAAAKLGARVHAVDFYSDSLTREKQLKYGINFRKLNIETTPFPYSKCFFDCVFMGEIIEHILTSPLSLLKQLNVLMKRDGILILTTPNVASIYKAMSLIRGQNIYWNFEHFLHTCHTLEGNLSMEDMHHREYSPDEIGMLMEKTGFKVIKHHFGIISPAATETKARRMIKRLILKLPFRRITQLRIFSSQQLVVARKVKSM